MSLPRYLQAAALVRAQITDGVLVPGAPAPSGAVLARATGFSHLTCRKALRTLVRDGVLVPGVSPNARPRVPAAGEHDSAGAVGTRAAGRNLSAGLASRRHAAGLTQTQLAEIAGVSVTTLGHAETGRLWQSRRFWEHADKALCADGALLELHDAFRAAAVPSELEVSPESIPPAEPGGVVLATVGLAVTGPVACVMITWADGAITTVYRPKVPCGQLAPPPPADRTGR